MPGTFARWMPGDSELIVSNVSGYPSSMVRFNLRTEEITPLFMPDPWVGFSISPDGSKLYYDGPFIDSGWSRGTHEYTFADESTRPITSGGQPAISPDGKKLALEKSLLTIHTISDSSNFHIGYRGSFPAWGPDNNTIVFFVDKVPPKIYMSDTLGQTRFLAYGLGSMDISPDGKTVIFSRTSGEDRLLRLWMINIDGSNLRQFMY